MREAIMGALSLADESRRSSSSLGSTAVAEAREVAEPLDDPLYDPIGMRRAPPHHRTPERLPPRAAKWPSGRPRGEGFPPLSTPCAYFHPRLRCLF